MNIATLEEIADAILRLTYRDMIVLGERLSEELAGEPVDADRMASILHSWAEGTATDL